MKTLEVHEKSTGTKFGLKERAELSVNHAFSPATRSYPSRRSLSVLVAWAGTRRRAAPRRG